MDTAKRKGNHMKQEEKTIVIHQPDFMPYLGFFDRLLHADTYVVLETAQYVNGTSKSWMNRDKIKTEKGEQWITVCVKKAPRETNIKDILLIDDGKWQKNNLGLFHQNYRKAEYYREIMPYVEALYGKNYDYFWDFSFASIKMLIELFDIDIEIIFSSDLNPQGKNNDMIVDIMNKLGARTYLSGTGAADYYDPAVYERAGIRVIWQEFVHPVYPQQFGAFIPYLSSIDLLFNCGIEQSRKILRNPGGNA